MASTDLAVLGYSGLAFMVFVVAEFAVLAAPVLIVIGWRMAARDKSEPPPERRKVIEWIVVVLGSLAATRIIIAIAILIAWATS